MTDIDIAIVGDRFMAPDAFVRALDTVLPSGIRTRTLELPWPDEAMVHGYGEDTPAGLGLEGLREFMGEPDAIAAFIGSASVFVNHLAPVTAPMLERLPELRLVAVSRGGPVNIDMAAARARGVRVVNTPGRNASAVAEFTVAAILVETRLIRAGHEALRLGIWRGDLYRRDIVGPELSECTVGIIGYGAIGTRVVALLKPFGCSILVADPYQELSAPDVADGVEMVTLDELLERSDIVSLHARVTDETRGFLGAGQFARMKPGGWFVNTGRGPMVDYEALYEALTSGQLRGAMLETFWEEPPPPEAALLKLPNVTLTPHIAGASTTTVKIAAAMVAEEVRRFTQGLPPLNPC